MNNEALNRLRVPAAWALLGAVVAHMLGGLIYTFGHDPGYEVSAAGNFTSVGSDLFYGPVLVAMLVAAVALVVTAPAPASVNFPVVLVALCLTGFAALTGVVGVITGFINANDTGSLGGGFASFLSIGGQLALIVVAGLFMLRVFGDHRLVPRSAPQQGMPMGQPGVPPYTGAQQSFAPQGYPTGGQQPFDQQGYATGGQAAYQQPQPQDWAAQQAYGGQQAYGAQQAYGTQQPQPDAYEQQYQQAYGPAPAADQGYLAQDPFAQAAYGADPAQQQYYGADAQGGQAYPAQDPAAQYPYGAGSGGQQPYPQTWGQPGEAYPGAGTGRQDAYQPGYGASGGQPAYGQDWQQQGYGQPGQAGYDPYGQYGQYGQQAYGTGGQPGYATGAGDQYYGAAGGQQPYGTGTGYTTGGQQYYSSGGQAPYGGDPAQQQAYATGTGGQSAYGAPYDPSQYAPQPGSEGERAAQEAIQYGWYQQPADQPEAPGEPRRDTPMEPFFHEDSAPTDQTQAVDPVYGTPYGQQAGEGSENPQGWYRDDDRR
ncbi:hypothetical protein [Streptomonospora salina]|uniref:Uncharacterized protein n=1 Tax=Streptomonospora salina TaxID=104205 RepID=A0A841E1K2_9ACTN|nr:hypothetical protein [Streptomonospora salina]MBB5997677.1 hypothetical protein [Streptomonospora salina]